MYAAGPTRAILCPIHLMRGPRLAVDYWNHKFSGRFLEPGGAKKVHIPYCGVLRALQIVDLSCGIKKLFPIAGTIQLILRIPRGLCPLHGILRIRNEMQRLCI